MCFLPHSLYSVCPSPNPTSLFFSGAPARSAAALATPSLSFASLAWPIVFVISAAFPAVSSIVKVRRRRTTVKLSTGSWSAMVHGCALEAGCDFNASSWEVHSFLSHPHWISHANKPHRRFRIHTTHSQNLVPRMLRCLVSESVSSPLNRTLACRPADR